MAEPAASTRPPCGTLTLPVLSLLPGVSALVILRLESVRRFVGSGGCPAAPAHIP